MNRRGFLGMVVAACAMPALPISAIAQTEAIVPKYACICGNRMSWIEEREITVREPKTVKLNADEWVLCAVVNGEWRLDE